MIFVANFYVVIFQTFAISLVKKVKPSPMTVSPDTQNRFRFRFRRMDHAVDYFAPVRGAKYCHWEHILYVGPHKLGVPTFFRRYLVSHLPISKSRCQNFTKSLFRSGPGAEYCNKRICLSVCLSVCEHISGTTCPIYTEFSCLLFIAAVRSFSGGVTICYVLPIL